MVRYNQDKRLICYLGVDIDWEYPGAPDRGGVNADTENFVTLLKEMRASWGSKYGISATLPSSYWYMRWFDLKGLFLSLSPISSPLLHPQVDVDR